MPPTRQWVALPTAGPSVPQRFADAALAPGPELRRSRAALRDGLVALTSELVAFDTVTHTAGAPPREERAQQEHVAALLRSHRAEGQLHEPDAAASECARGADVRRPEPPHISARW
jgi:hypothetical protein